jgi:lysophospholipase L1-like esterase
MNPAKVKSEDWHDRHSYEWLPELCRRYGCGLVDVRRPWLQYPTENHLRATDVLSDGTHLNAQGNWLLAELTKRCLRSNAALPQVTRAGLVRDYSAGSDFSWKDGRR